MTNLRLITLSARSATVMLTPPGTSYHLAQTQAWSLSADGTAVLAGQSQIAPVFVEDLSPDTDYVFECALGKVPFRTPSCAGLIDASDFGVSNSALDNSDAMAQAIAAVPEGGTLKLPRGRVQSGPIFLKPHMTLYLPQGSKLQAITDRTHWPILSARDADGRVLGSWEGLPEACYAAPITAIDCPGLQITGRGVIDGAGAEGDWWSWPKGTRNGARRPRTLFMLRCPSAVLSGFTIRNSPSWTVHPMFCDQLVAAALRIENPPDSPNTDGFNPESCCDVTMTGLHFSVGDDCIAVKAGKRAPCRADHLAPTERLTISHCHMERGHGAVVLGSEMSGSIRDVTISDCSFEGTDRGLRIKTRRGRGGEVSNVTMRDVQMSGVDTAISANGHYFCDPDGTDDWVQNRNAAPVDETTPRIGAIRVRNVVARDVCHAAVAMLGLAEAPITDIELDNLRVSFDPNALPGVPLMASGVDPVLHETVIAQNATVTGTVERLSDNKEPQPC